MAFASEPTRPNTFGTPGCEAKSSISLFNTIWLRSVSTMLLEARVDGDGARDGHPLVVHDGEVRRAGLLLLHRQRAVVARLQHTDRS